MISCPCLASALERLSTMTPSPPTVDHLPNSGVIKTIGPN